ncbi:lachesin-like [Haliotis cracherodii]|uniref:lachesin-like n=1 Tax=Haliotis cracherodii TaxID=6455 RepID=UPI0039EB76AF
MLHSVAMLAVLLYSALADLAPKFNTTPEHVTVKAGDKAILPCTVEYIGDNTVIWVSPRKQLISHSDRRMIDDQRITIERPYVKEWNLHINDVRYNDSGVYKCEINTVPEQEKAVKLSVLVPPAIISRLSSDNIRLREGEVAELICNVTGVPQPNVTWNKRNYRMGRGRKERIGLEGEMLLIHNVTRYCDDIYECFVDNGVPPSVSKAIRVIVEFAPEVTMPNRRMGQKLGRETILQCSIYAHPQGLTFWKRNGLEINNDDKFMTEAYADLENRIVTLSLRIKEIEKEDFGSYTCEGSNYLGSDEEEMILYELEPVIITTPTTTTTREPPYDIIPGNGYDTGIYEDHHRKATTSTAMYPLFPPMVEPDKERGNEEKALVLGHSSCSPKFAILEALIGPLILTLFHMKRS